MIAAAPRGLKFGYNRGLPPDASAAWGARWIIKQNGHVAQVYDRQDAFGPEEVRKEIVDYLNDVVKGQHIEEAVRLLKGPGGGMYVGSDKEFTLYHDWKLVIRANPQASHGYLYVCAFLVKDLPLVSEYENAEHGDGGEFALTDTAEFTGKDVIVSRMKFPAVQVGGIIGAWSNKDFLPKIGERVNVRMNGIGPSLVVAYFRSAGFIGVEVRPEKPPKWYVDQNEKGRINGLMFGIDIEPIKE